MTHTHADAFFFLCEKIFGKLTCAGMGPTKDYFHQISRPFLIFILCLCQVVLVCVIMTKAS